MVFALTEDQSAIVDAVGALCGKFDDDYWLERDEKKDHGFAPGNWGQF